MRPGLKVSNSGSAPIESLDDPRVGSVDERLGVTLGQVGPDSAVGSSRRDRHRSRSKTDRRRDTPLVRCYPYPVTSVRTRVAE